MKYHISIIVLILWLISSLTYATERSLRTSYYLQNIAPQLFFDKYNQPISGILFDITHAIADQLDMKLEMLAIPRKRIERSLENNTIDMDCIANPDWYESETLQWSRVIYQNPDVLINRKGMTSITELSAHRKLKIGTTLGYVYAELSPYISNEQIQPVISLSADDSHKKYRKHKVSGFVSASVEALYFTKDAKDSIIPLNNNNIHCVLSPNMTKLTVQRINTAIKTLIETGEIEAILTKYKNIATLMPQIDQSTTD